MIFPRAVLIIGILATFLSLPQLRANEFENVVCDKSHLQLAPIDSSEHRKYAPDRPIDIQHVSIDATPDFVRRTVATTTAIRFRPFNEPVTQLRLDAVDLTVESVRSDAGVQSYHSTGNEIVITFDRPIAVGTESTVTITASAEPAKGLYFRTPEMGYKPGDTHLFTQGEPIEARHWYPCFDAPNEKFTSEVICRVPDGMIALSNGILVSQEKDATSGLVVFRWLQDKPHVNYLISLVAGYFKKIEDRYNDVAMAFYTPPSQINEAIHSFRDTKDMMAFFEKEIGVPYPWAKYDQVCVQDFVAGGMENTSVTTLADRTLHTADTENIVSSQGLVAHELAHQWFGNLVTCKDWSHLWLNEGFATYYAHLYDGYKNGRDTLLYGLYNDANRFIDRPDDNKPIVFRGYDSPTEQFSYLAYPKGSWVLHMLRSQLGEELFRRCVKTYLERHQYQNVVTEDLNAVVEELSGRSFDPFFDQWVYHAHHPELGVQYSWDSKAKLAKISIAQNQKLSPDVLLFRFPLTIRFKLKDGTTVDHQILVKEKAEDFYFPLASAPEIVRVDPEFTLLAKTRLDLPDPMLHAQLADTTDVIGRLRAVEQLGAKKSQSAVAKLKGALQNDPFYGVRVHAAQALRKIHSDEAFAALADSLDQSDARVRHEVINAVAGFYRDDAFQLLQRHLNKERNPAINARALQGISSYFKSEVNTLLLEFLDRPSYRNSLGDAAIRAMRAQDDARYLTPIQEALEKRATEFTTAGIAEGLNALAYLARNESDKSAVREFICRYVNDPRRRVQLAALSGLGTLQDLKAIPLLETFAGADKDSPQRRSAESALAELRDARKPSVELGNLRNEVLELQKANRELKKELDDLKKRFDASAAALPAADGAAPKSRRALKRGAN